MNRGFTITTSGAALLTSLLAGEQLEITKVMVGKGRLVEGQEPADLTELIEPVALATTNTPTVSGQQVDMVVEYRNDLNGGLAEAFYLDEFGVWGKKKGDAAEASMIYYATLGDYPQWVGPISAGLDVRRYPVAIGLATRDVGVQLNYPAGAFVTAEEFKAALADKANETEVTAALSGKMQHGSVSLSNYTTVLEVATSVAVDASVFASQDQPLFKAEDSPLIGAEIQYLVLMDYGPRRTVIATQYLPGNGIIRTWKRQLFDGRWMQPSWTQDATTTPPEEHALPLAEGVTPRYKSLCRKNQMGDIVIRASLALPNADASVIAVCTLPVGYRPSDATELPVTFTDSANAAHAGTAKIEDGVVSLQRPVAGYAAVFFNWTL